MKLIQFVDQDGNYVWINPEKVCRVHTRKEHCSIYTNDGGMVWLPIPATIAVDILNERCIIKTEENKKTSKGSRKTKV